MYSGLNNKLSNVPTITGLANVVADQVVTDTLIVDGNDIGVILDQVPINTANIAALQQVTTGQTYASVGDTTTFDNNVTLGAGKTMTADNFTGLASNASQVLVTLNDTATTYYPTFATAGTGQKGLLLDSTTTPFSYVPSTSTLSATNFTAGTNVTTPNILGVSVLTPSNARNFSLNGTPIGNGGNTSCVFMGNGAGTQAPNTAPNNNFCFGSNSGSQLTTGGVQNLFIGANSGNLVTSGRNNCFLGASAGRKTTSGAYNTQIGGQSQIFPDENAIGSYNTTIGAESYILNDGLSFSTAIGANVVASTSNTVRIGRSVDNTIFDGTVTMNNNLLLTSPATTLTPTELSYLDGATSNIQAQINAFPAAANTVTTNTTQTITADKTFSGTVTLNNNLLLTSPATTLTPTELSYLDGATSNIQAQINAFPAAANTVTTNTVQTITANKTFTGTTNLGVTNITGDCIFPAGSTTWFNNNLLISANALGSAATLRVISFAGTLYLQAGATSSSGTADIVFSSIFSGTPWATMNTSGLTMNNTNITLGASSNLNLGTTVQSRISTSGSTITLTNNNIGGTYDFTVSTSGLPLTILSLNETNAYYRVPFIVSAQSAATSVAAFSVTNSASSKGINMLSDSASGAYNALVTTNDSVIYGTSPLVTTSHLTLTTWSATTTGVRISPTQVVIGAGGAAAAPTASTTYSGTTVTVAGNTQFSANNITIGGTNINVGQGAGGVSNIICGNTNAKGVVFASGNNSIFGTSAGQNMTTLAGGNTFLGNSAGLGNTDGDDNVFVGSNSGFQTANGTGTNNVCVGNGSGQGMITTAVQNTFVGAFCGYQTSASGTGNNNTVLGYNSARLMSGAGIQNTFIGAITATQCSTSNRNTVCGCGSLSVNTVGNNNSVFGNTAGDNITGSDNICIGYLSTVPTAAGNNQIAIGRASETMYIRGGFNWRVGAQITNSTNGNLATAVLAQFYTVAMSAASQTITLPNPTNAAYLGAYIMLKRRSNNTAFTLTSTGGAGFIPVGGVGLSASPHTVAATIFNVHLVNDGVNWLIIGQL
jgi:hypothetical protein